MANDACNRGKRPTEVCVWWDVHNHHHEALLAVLAGQGCGAAQSGAPRLNWVIHRHSQRKYVKTILRIAKAYGVGRICLTAGRPSACRRIPDDLTSEGLPIEFCDLDSEPVFDAAGRQFGGGTLPWLAMDRLKDHVDQAFARGVKDIYVEIDTPAQTCYDTPSWINVFAASLLLRDPALSADQIIDSYVGAVFEDAADAVNAVFRAGQVAMEKTFTLCGSLWAMEDSTWPTDIRFYDRQVDADHPPTGIDPDRWQANIMTLAHPARTILADVDKERVDGLEAAYRAMNLLEEARSSLRPERFLFLEHYYQRLKAVCRVLRRMVVAWLFLRAARQQTFVSSRAGLFGKLKDLRQAIDDHKSIVMATPSSDYHTNLRRITSFVDSYADAIDELYPKDSAP
jgi:hypothetical protein